MLSGEAELAKLEMVAINTAAIIWLAGKADDLKSATAMALEALSTGQVKRHLNKIVATIGGLS